MRGPRSGPLAAPPPGSGLAPVMGEPGRPLVGKTLGFLRRGPELSLEQYDRYGTGFLLEHRIEVPTGYEVRWDMTSLPSPADGLPVVLRPLT